MSLRFFSLVCLTSLLGAAVGPASACAHGRYPETGQVVFGPSGLVLVRATFGVVLSQDGGTSWGLVCPEALGMLLTENPSVAIATSPGGPMESQLLVALFGGLRAVATDGCDVRDVEGPLGNRVVIDVSTSPMNPSRVLAVTSDGSMDNAVFASSDGGTTFVDASGAISRILFEAVAIAPSDASRVYLSGSFPPSSTSPRRPFFFRSDDGGATFAEIAFPDFGEDDRNIYVEAVDPLASDRVVLRVDGLTQDRLMLSEDGGTTFTEILRGPELTAATFDATGHHLFTGGKLGTGLHRSTRAGTFTDFTQVAPVSVGCLAFHEGKLFACGDQTADGFAVGVSSNLGASFSPFMHLADAAHDLRCDGAVSTATLCASAVDDLRTDLGLDLLPTTPDAAVRGSGGCHVVMAPQRAAVGALCALGLTLGVWLRRRSRS